MRTVPLLLALVLAAGCRTAGGGARLGLEASFFAADSSQSNSGSGGSGGSSNSSQSGNSSQGNSSQSGSGGSSGSNSSQSGNSSQSNGAGGSSGSASSQSQSSQSSGSTNSSSSRSDANSSENSSQAGGSSAQGGSSESSGNSSQTRTGDSSQGNSSQSNSGNSSQGNSSQSASSNAPENGGSGPTSQSNSNSGNIWASVAVTTTVAGIGALIWLLARPKAAVEPAAAEAAHAYLQENAAQLRIDLALGRGRTIDDIAAAAELPPAHVGHFGRLLHRHRSELLDLAAVDAVATLKRIGAIARADPLLAPDCDAYVSRHAQ